MTELTNKPVMDVDWYGNKFWYLNGKLHREDGPAIEWADGNKRWYLNGKYHREDGPAVECTNGTKHWYLNGKLHREDGPAVEWADGYKSWYLNGREVTEEEHKKRTSDKPKEVTSKYHRDDLIRSIKEMNPNCHPSQTGMLKAVLSSVLISVETHDPKLFQEIMQFEMRCQERMKALD